VSLHASWTQWKPLFSFEVSGHDGYVVVEGLGGAYGTERAILGRRDFGAPFHEEAIEFRGDDRSWEEEWREFVAAIREGREPLASGEDGLAALELAQAIYESARSGRAVGLPPLGSKTRP
jgi:predicted dehydrogenase